jgi:hypothetical protein
VPAPAPTARKPRVERQDSTDHRDCADSTDPVLSHDPAETNDRAEPIDPTDSALPIDPTDRLDPTDPMESTDPTEPIDNTESFDHRDNTEPEEVASGSLMSPSCPSPPKTATPPHEAAARTTVTTSTTQARKECQGYPDGMTDTGESSSIPASPELHRLSPRDESRVALALTLRQMADAVLDAVPVEPDPAPGDLLRTALKLQRRMEDVVREAVVAERERGTTWSQIGDAAGVTRQSAHEKWYSDVHGWAAIGRSALPPELKTLEVAAEADARYARLRPDRPHAVTSGLDAVRFPGSHAYEASLRARGSALHIRRTDLDARATELNDQYSDLHANGPTSTPIGDDLLLIDTHRGHADAVRANRLAIAAVHDEISAIYDELVTAEPSLAEEHRTQSEWHHNASEQARSYADLLNSKRG